MEYVNQNGPHIKIACERCRAGVWVPLAEMKVNGTPIICDDCRTYLRNNPENAEREFQAALRRSQQDSIDMRVRWAKQDAAKRQGAA